MTPEEFYGEYYNDILLGMSHICSDIENIIKDTESSDDLKPIVYYTKRIKSPDSLIDKLENRGINKDIRSALDNGINDIIGTRIVCAFNDDVYKIADILKSNSDYSIINEKDYIRYPKPNGYRSLHLIMRIEDGDGKGLPVEVQLRSIAMDFWSTIEHKVRYKKATGTHRDEMLKEELKRCADEIASMDISMSTIRDFIRMGDTDAE